MKKYYKIVENDNGQLKTVHYYINGTRTLKRDCWIKADIKEVSDRGKGRRYISGIHILPTKESAEDYMKKFKRNLENKIIVPCLAKGIKRKEHSRGDVYLANQIKII